MPRPKPSKALPLFSLRGCELSEGASNKLIELLGYGDVDLCEESVRRQMPGYKIMDRTPGAPLRLKRDPNPQAPVPDKDVGKIILDIETALGIYADGYQHLDDIPRPADYVAVFKPIYRDAIKLLNTLANLHGYYSEQLRFKWPTFHQFLPELASLVDATNAVVKDFEKRPSKGARENRALMETIRKLRRIFRDHYAGARESRRKQGAIHYRAAWEKREREFVKLALRDAQIIPEGYEALDRLFRDRRSIPEERNAAPDTK